MIDIKKLLCEVCGDDAAGEPGVDLIESGLLDSLALIELFSRLEDEGIELHPTRIDRDRLRTAESIEELVREAEKNG
ncbi:MAG: D-alanine--poly(phosphoribitol) ligase subunit 2 [Clostridia bacterium]|nr:D-alanine--poly(phosphoribitol) ligase subunit 2 [Clostridia bacterium]